MVLPTTIDEALEDTIEGSVQSRGKRQPFGDIPVTGYDSFLNDAGVLFTLGTATEHIPVWSIYPARRDRALRRFYRTEPIMAGAVYSLSTRIKSLGWKLSGEDDLHEGVENIFGAMDFGLGLRGLLSKSIIDFSSQDNGFFWELVGAGNPEGELLGGVVEGVNYLDPAQCYRTFDPDYPVLYIDPINGKRHKLHRTRVLSRSSMTQPNELARGIGYSAVSRALLSVQLYKAMQQFRYEKVSGSFERAIGYVTGMTQATLQSLLQQVSDQDANEGFTRFGRIPFFASARENISMNILDLASIPDGFDLLNETNIYIYIVALVFGVDAREFWPATSSGATKADASIQNMKARGKGLADLITTVEDALNQYVLPAGVAFEFDFVDDENDRSVAESHAVIVNTLTTIKTAGGLSQEQYQAMLIHEGILDEAILEDAGAIALLETEEGEEIGEPGEIDDDGMGEMLDSAIEQRDEIGQIFGYHIELGVVSINETRESLGFPPIADPDGERFKDLSRRFSLMQEGVAAGLDKAEVADLIGLGDIAIEEPEPVAIVPQSPFAPSTGDTGGSPGNGATGDDKPLELEDATKTIASYRRGLRVAVRGFWNREFGFTAAVGQMDSVIRRGVTQAFIAGAKEGGLRRGDFTPGEIAALESLIAEEQSHVGGFLEWVAELEAFKDGKISQAFNRLDLWLARYDQAFQKGLIFASTNKKLKWDWDPAKDHCIDCTGYNGMVFRGSVWDEGDIEPQSTRLACFGLHCGCGLRETDDPVDRGKPPKPSR